MQHAAGRGKQFSSFVSRRKGFAVKKNLWVTYFNYFLKLCKHPPKSKRMAQHSFKNDLQKLNLLKTAGFEKEFAWRAKTLIIANIYTVRTGKQKTSVMLTSDSTSTPKEVHKLGVDVATWLWGRGKISQLNKPPYKHPEHQMKYKFVSPCVQEKRFRC